MAWLCAALDVSRSDFHAWLNRSPSARSRQDEVLVTTIDRRFTSSAEPEVDHRIRCADLRLTYLRTAEGWLYFAAVVDLFSRRVVSWAMKAEMKAQLFTDALLAARRTGRPHGLLHHSDQGNQDTSEQFQRLMYHDIKCSMSRSGSEWQLT